MSKSALIARIWPSRPSLEQELSRQASENPGGLLLVPPAFTFDSLLPAILEPVPLDRGQRPLLPLAGPILIQALLQEDNTNVFAGLSAGHRFPDRLWRLLLEVKAAGLAADDLRKILGQRARALAGLMEGYQKALDQLGLADQADRLAGLERMLEQGRRPPLLARWAALTAQEVLWLRAMDIRLLRVLSRHIKIRIQFAMLPPGPEPGGVFSLLQNTARCLEAGQAGEIDLEWADRLGQGGPLAQLASDLGSPGLVRAGLDPKRLELLLESGRYTEVEALVRRARDLLEQGVPPGEVALVFPDLELYGQMAADAAGRLGLELKFSAGQPLAQSPLVLAVLDLLQLPLAGYPRELMARVWQSPYLAGPLAHLLEITPQNLPVRVKRVLQEAGYVDGRETPPGEWLRQAAQRPGPQGRGLEVLALACEKLKTKLDIFGHQSNLKDYSARVRELVAALNISRFLTQNPAPALVQARDLAADAALGQTLAELEGAAGQVAFSPGSSPARLFALLRQALGQARNLPAGGSQNGVWVLPLDQAMGLRLHTVLVGGLCQGEFPRRQAAQNLMSGEERLALGRLAGLPVWRTDEEEYSGQMLRLSWLLASVREKAVLSAPAADIKGKEAAPAFVLQNLAGRLGRQLSAPPGGVFGRLPPLDQAQEPLALWAGLAKGLLRPQAESSQKLLAQAALWDLCQKDREAARRWQDLAQRTDMEQARAGLDLLVNVKRLTAADAFSGRITSQPALDMLRRIFSQDKMRRLSPSSLEMYAACPMSWFFSYLLGLEIPAAPVWDLERRAEGEWVHRTLALFFAPAEFALNCQETARVLRLEACLDKAENELSAQGRAGHPLVRKARRPVLLAALGRVVSQECEMLAGLRTMAVEADFGKDDAILSVETPDGPELVLRGRLDRLDAGQGFLQVTDYKHSADRNLLKDPVNKATQGVSAFQIPVYLAAAGKIFGTGQEALKGRIVPTRLAGEPAQEIAYGPNDPFLAGDHISRRRLAKTAEPNLFNAIAGLWQAMLAGDFVPRPEGADCSYCQFKGICRAQASPAQGAENDG